MYDYKNKERNISRLNDYMLVKTLSMFNYENLPPTLSGVEMEKQLQKFGYTFITEVDGNLYSFAGTFGGEVDVYNQPTNITINNVALNFTKTLSILDDGVLVKNDDLQLGLLPLYDRYNTALIENEITMFIHSYNSRIQTLISAGDDTTKESAEKYLEKIIAGELGIIGENRLFEGVKAQNTQTAGSVNMQHLIEYNQYLKASLYNEVGLNANFNMKRERLNSSEVELNTDNLYPFIDNMFWNRLDGLKKLNEKYGCQVAVDFGSTWGKNNSDESVKGDNEDDKENG